MTLSVLSLLVVLALSYALTSIAAQKTVEYSQNLIKARLMGETGFSQAYQMLATDFADPMAKANLFPATKTGQTYRYGPTFTTAVSTEWNGRYFWISTGTTDVAGLDSPSGTMPDFVLHTQVGSVDLVPETSFYADAVANNYSWVHLLDAASTYPAGDTPIIARFAYLVIDESGKIDPSAIIDDGTPEGSEARKGADPDEINLGAVLDVNFAARFQTINHWTSSDTPCYLPIYQQTNIDGEDVWELIRSDSDTASNGLSSSIPQYPSKWYSHHDIFTQFKYFETSIWSDNNGANRAAVLENLFPFSYDVEAFFNGTEDKHRYNLGGNTNWDNLTIYDLIVEGTDFWQYAADGDVGGTNASSGGISWFYNSPQTPVLVRQIAANLIDYCDSNSYATTDFPTTVPPTYTGNDETPYINELVLGFTLDDDGANLTLTGFWSSIEFVNMYEDDYSTGADAVITFDLVKDGVVTQTGIKITHSFADGSTWAGKESYILIEWPAANLSPTITAASMSLSAENISVTLVESADSSHLLDYAMLPNLTDTPVSVAAAGVYAVQFPWIIAEVNDPRHNLSSTQWVWGNQWHQWEEGEDAKAIASAGTRNSICRIGDADGDANGDGVRDMDIEQEVDGSSGNVEPWTVSTAYIRNGPMESLWEIGAIHRGSAWQTINLHTFNTQAYIQYMPTTGLDDYYKGDAHLLDQIKLASSTEVSGRVNINTYNENVLRALLMGIRVGGRYDDVTAGEAITADDAGKIIGSYPFTANDGTLQGANGSGLTAGGTAAGAPFRFRGEAVTASYLTLSDTTIFSDVNGISEGGNLDKMTDAKAEEIIGKVANLTTVRQNYFTVISVAQVVKDMPTGYMGGTRGVFDPPTVINETSYTVDRVLTEQKMMAVYYRDALRNRFKVVRYEYIDE